MSRQIAIAAVVLACLALAAPAAGAPKPPCNRAPGRGLTLTNVAADGGELVAVGSNGLLASASAARPGRWTVEPSPTRHDVRGVAWNGERWVAVGDLGTILVRGEGGWTKAAGVPPLSLRAIAAGAEGFVAGGTGGGAVSSSRSGEAWGAVTSGTTSTLWGGTAFGRNVALAGQDTTVVARYGDEPFVTVPTFPRPTDSSEAKRPFLWQIAADQELTGPSVEIARLYPVAVVAVGDFGAILTGTLAGGLHGVKSPTEEILRGVAHAGNRWVAVGSGGVVLYSSDGRHWKLGGDPTTADLRGVVHTPAGWFAVGDQSTVIFSRDGIQWRVVASTMPCSLLGLAAGRSGLVAVGGNGRVLLSPNGRAWRPVRRPTTEDLYSVARGRGSFVAVGAGGVVLRSRGGRVWRPRRSPVSLNLHTAFWTGREYLAGGDRGRVIASRDGRDWRRIPFPAFHSVRDFAGDGHSVIAAGAGTIARRPSPGAGWELESAGFQHFQTGVAYGDGRYVIVGHNGQALSSADDGRTWEAGKSGVEVNLDTVIWTGGAFLASGEGTAIESSDGLTWQPRALGTPRAIRALVRFRGGIVGVGDGGARVRLPGGSR